MSKIPQEAIDDSWVSDAVFTAFNDAYSDQIELNPRETHQALYYGLTAAFNAARAQGAEVAVKSLEWRVFCNYSGNCEAKSAIGEYVIQFEYPLLQSFWALYLPDNDHNTGIKYTTIEEAKAAAQADYEQRIRSAFTAPPAPQPTDREKVLEKALRFYADPKNWIDTPPWDGDPECTTLNAIPFYQDEGSRICDCGDTARAALAGGEA